MNHKNKTLNPDHLDNYTLSEVKQLTIYALKHLRNLYNATDERTKYNCCDTCLDLIDLWITTAEKIEKEKETK